MDATTLYEDPGRKGACMFRCHGREFLDIFFFFFFFFFLLLHAQKRGHGMGHSYGTIVLSNLVDPLSDQDQKDGQKGHQTGRSIGAIDD